eukprot:jgi/Orpsp1_1/1190760/evm.model.d7180000081067.1
MVFCSEINSIKLDDNGKIFEINRENNNNEIISEDCHKLLLNIKEDDKYFKRRFLYVKNEEINEELSDRFEVERKLRICVAIEIDNNNKIFVDTSSPCLFCSLPLVGSEKHEFPFIINSPDFEPDSERQSILLNGNKINEKTNKISNPGINKMILEKSQSMYEILLNYICQNYDIKDRYLLARGLHTAPENDEINNFDHDWYEKEFIEPMRNILIKYPIVWNGEKFVKITDIYLPLIECYENKNIKKQAYKFICKIYNNKVPTFKESLNFENSIWKNDKRIKYTSMNECTNDLSKYKNMDNLSKKIKNSWEWIDEFLIFIEKYHHEYLKNYSIIPNMNSEFVKITEELTTCREVPNNMIDCLTKLNNPWKSNHIHKNIIKYNPKTPHNIDYAVLEIKNIFKKWSNDILILISYIPNFDNNIHGHDHEYKEYVEKRNTIYELCSCIWNNLVPDKNDGNSFPKQLWDKIDEIVFKKIIENIENNKNVNNIYSIKFMKKFLECVLQYYPEFRNHSIIPNKNGKFCKVNELYEDDDIPSLFKLCMKNYMKYDIDNELINDELLPINLFINNQKKSISDYIEIVNNYLSKNKLLKKKQKEAARILIRIIPRIEYQNENNIENDNEVNEWQINQRNLFKVFEIFTKRNDESIEIDCNEKIKELWRYTNNFIYNDIIKIIEKYKDVKSLAAYLDIEKSKIFEYLNIILKFSSQTENKGKIFPNQYEEFCSYNENTELCLCNEGIYNSKSNKVIELIPEILKDISKDLNFDIRKFLIHPNIDRSCISNIVKNDLTYNNICKEIDERMEKLYYNSLIEKDIKFKEASEKLIEFHFENLKNNKLENENINIFNKVYSNNARDKLLKLENPNDIESKRWIWELCQNAINITDNENKNTGIDINIIIKDDQYIFMHNKSVFTTKTICDLLYTFNYENVSSSHNLKHFGEIFFNTHSLSKVVDVSGDINLNGEIKGFSFCINREGNNQDILNKLKETENSFQFCDDPKGWTSYKYLIKNEKNKKVTEMGIQNFKENITKVMLFCPEINSIKLDDNGKIFEINRESNNYYILSDQCHELMLNINEENNSYLRSFLYINKEESIIESITESNNKFEIDNNIKICCAIEIDNDNLNIFDSSSSFSSSSYLFSQFPLIGLEKYKLPFIINSPNFKYDFERISNILYENEINKIILKCSEEMYENLLKCISQNYDIQNRYLLTRGLSNIPGNDKNNENEWYEKEFIEPMREILIKYPIVWNGNQFVKLTDIYLPFKYYKDKDKDENIKEQAFNFIAQVYNNNVPTFEESKNYENYIWENDKNINYITMEDCIKKLSKYENMENLSEVFENAWSWLDDFLVFINNLYREYLEIYSIIPNMNSEFVKLTGDLTTSKSVPDDMIECLESLGNSWKLNHIHKKIVNYNIGTDHNTKFALSEIKKDFEKWPIEKLLILISYIPNCYDENMEYQNFIKKRRTVYELCSKVWNNLIPQKNNGSSFPRESWDGVDEILFKKIIEKIENNKIIGDIYNIEFMKKFLECISQYYPEFKNYSIIPNQNGQFCKLENLNKDDNIPSLFKECMNRYFNRDIKNELIDNEITTIKSLIIINNKGITDYNNIIIDYFKLEDISNENMKKEAARYLIRIIPKMNIENENQINDWKVNQRHLFEIFEIFTKRNDECIEIEYTEKLKDSWYFVNEYIYNDIKEIIESYEDVSSLSEYLDIEKNKLFEYLNIIIKFSLHMKNKGKIFPNQYEQFCEFDHLYNEGMINVKTNEFELIDEKLKDIAKKLNYDVREHLFHKNIERIPNIHNVSEKDVNEKIVKIIEDDPSILKDPKYNDIITRLNELNFKKIRENKFNDEMMYIFSKVYMANIRNRLRELENPTLEDCKRWVWELIQNAKDSIADKKDKTGIDIEIIVKDDKYIFKHNGSPFTSKTLPALLYKFSEGKGNSSESTGRFGTGFLTTHSLSKTVNISGDIITEDGQLKGFTVTMYREGDEKELLEGLKNTKNNYKEFPIDSHQWTIYEYTAKTEKNREAGRLGIQNFRDNITKTMVFCPEINSIKLDDNGKIFEINREYNNNEIISENCHKLLLNIKEDDKYFKRSFLYVKNEEINEELSDRFEVERKLRICVAIEIDDNNNIIVD